MKVLAFRHVPFEDTGRIAPILEERGIVCDYADLYKPGAAAPAVSPYAGLIVLGGPMSANDALPFLEQERKIVGEALERGQPLLGVCLGSQLIAHCLGARIHRNPQKEIGWFDIHFTEAAEKDTLFRGIRGPETVFHWHSDTWDLPDGAERLAWSDACGNQAFRYGGNVYGVQFHLEVTPTMIADWQLQDENCGDVRELPAPINPTVNLARLDELSRTVFGRWCGLL